MITYAVKRINNLESLSEDLLKLGTRHSQYGVTTDHYPQVAASLLWTLETFFNDSKFSCKDFILQSSGWSPESTQAWTLFYTSIANSMLNIREQ